MMDKLYCTIRTSKILKALLDHRGKNRLPLKYPSKAHRDLVNTPHSIAYRFGGMVLSTRKKITEDDASTSDVTIQLAVNEGEYEAHNKM